MLMWPLASDPPGTYKVLTSRTHALTDVLPEGSIFRINTGGPLPAGADTVIMVEDTELLSTAKDVNGQDAEEKEVKTLVQVPPSDNVREPGSDVHKGDLVLQRGEVLTSLGGEVGTLTFVGRKEVCRRISMHQCGYELVSGQSAPQAHCRHSEYGKRASRPPIS